MENKSNMKIVMLGESGVGKTCILNRYINNTFEAIGSTSYAKFQSKVLYSSDNQYELKQTIWDTAGQEIYRSLAPFYYKDADGVVLVYDITNETSFNELSYWLDEVKENGKSDVLITVAGNKSAY